MSGGVLLWITSSLLRRFLFGDSENADDPYYYFEEAAADGHYQDTASWWEWIALTLSGCDWMEYLIKLAMLFKPSGSHK